MGNLPAHETPAVRHAIELRLPPPYSPDFNPIKPAFCKIKALLKKAAARTVADLWHDIRDAINAVTTADCRSLLTATGYEPG